MLSGIKGVEISRIGLGPFIAMHLGDFGADLIAVAGVDQRGGRTNHYQWSGVDSQHVWGLTVQQSGWPLGAQDRRLLPAIAESMSPMPGMCCEHTRGKALRIFAVQ